MRRISAVILGICSGVFVLGMIQNLGADDASHGEAHPARKIPKTPGRSYMEVQEIVERHHDQLMQVPNVYIVAAGGNEIFVGAYVYTDSQGKKPSTLPAALQALPAAIEGIPVDIHPVYLMRPPDGFIVLKPAKVREQAESCPKGFEEVDGYGGWRFCVDRKNPDKIPNLWSPSIAGIPYEQAQEIYKRHQKALMSLPGVEAVELGADGIYVSTKEPEVVPPEVEGVPIIIQAPHGQTIRHADHTRFREIESSTWRFCVDGNSPKTIPAIMTPPIADIPYEEAMAIHDRHQMELFQLPGVSGVGLGAEGIIVHTDSPDILPKEVEGLPIIPAPPWGPGKFLPSGGAWN